MEAEIKVRDLQKQLDAATKRIRNLEQVHASEAEPKHKTLPYSTSSFASTSRASAFSRS